MSRSPAGGVPLIGQQQAVANAMVEKHLVMTAQGMFNQVVGHMLITMDTEGHREKTLTHEKMVWLAEQCRAAAPYVLLAFGAVKMDQILPNEGDA